MSLYAEITAAVIKGNRAETVKQTKLLLEAGKKPLEIVEGGLVPGMAVVGEKFKNNEIFVPEMLIAARAMKESMLILEPMLAAAGITPKYTLVIGTVEGDLHDIGKNLVAMMFKGANFKVVDLGVNVPAAKFVEAIKEHKPNIVALSALLTTTMPSMRTAIDAITAAGLRKTVTIMIGGAPVSADYAKEITADGYSADAASAVEEAMKFLNAA